MHHRYLPSVYENPTCECTRILRGAYVKVSASTEYSFDSHIHIDAIRDARGRHDTGGVRDQWDYRPREDQWTTPEKALRCGWSEWRMISNCAIADRRRTRPSSITINCKIYRTKGTNPMHREQHIGESLR